MTIPKTIHFKIDKTIKITSLLHFIWDLALVIAIIVLAAHAKAATIPTRPGNSQSPKSSSNGGLSSLITKPTISNDLINKIAEAQKPLPPPPEPAPEPAPLLTDPTYANDYVWGNCTAYIASVVHVPDNLGNANTWAAVASQDGYTVSTEPKVGAVAQTTAGSLGHVALVEAVDGPNVLVKEQNYVGLGIISERWATSGEFNYIYF